MSIAPAGQRPLPAPVPADADAEAFERAARALLPDGDPHEALRLAQQGERLARARGAEAVAAWCLLHQARALTELSDPRALGTARSASRALAGAGEWEGAAWSHALAAHRLAVAAADGVVEELANAAVALDRVDHPSLDLALAHHELAQADLAIGLYDAAHVNARLALAVAAEAGIHEATTLRLLATLGDVVRVQVAQARRGGDDTAARAVAREWLEGWPRLAPRARRHPVLWPRLAAIAGVLLTALEQDLMAAIALLDEARLAGADQPRVEVLALAGLARVNLLTGHLAAAQHLLDTAERLAVVARVHGELVGLAETRALVHEAAEDPVAALHAFRRYHQLAMAEMEHHRQRQADAVRARVAEMAQHSVVTQLAEAANTDALTGLRNRRFLDTEAPALLDARRAAGVPVCVGVVDVDKFKQVNDQYGHATGDAVLVQLSGLLRAGLRDADIVVRTGGDEFVLLLVGAEVEQARRVLERVRQLVERHEWTALGLPPVTMTIGASALDPSRRLEEAIEAADAQLYEAKRAGRNVVRAG